MAVLLKSCRLLSSPQLIVTSVRLGHINSYEPYKPKPYPKTQKEREEAAARYGLELEEYKPYPDDGVEGLGDYPQVPIISDDAKDPYYPYDYPESKRNYNEPLHIWAHMTSEGQWDCNERRRYTKWKEFRILMTYVGSFFALMYLGRMYPLIKPVTIKQMPYTDQVHYSFELE